MWGNNDKPYNMRGLQPFPTIAKGLKPYVISPAFPYPRPEGAGKFRLAIAAPQLKKSCLKPSSSSLLPRTDSLLSSPFLLQGR